MSDMKFDLDHLPNNRRKKAAEALLSVIAWAFILLVTAIVLGGLAWAVEVIWSAVLR